MNGTSGGPGATLADCTIIVGTLARRERGPSLRRAIASLIPQAGPAPAILVVVNGRQADPAVLAALAGRTEVELLQIPQESFGVALLAGRQAVRTRYFGFLDDDDEYLPGGLARRMEALLAEPAADLVVTNGLSRTDRGDFPAYHNLPAVAADPLGALFRESWLASCGGLFRTDRVPVTLFADSHPYFEWSWLAFRLATAGARIAVLDEATFVVNDTPGSASKEPRALLSAVAYYRRLLSLPQRPDLKGIIDRRLCRALHCLADHQMQTGQIPAAWRHHWASLRSPGGWRHLSFSLRLLAASARTMAGGS